MSDKIRWQLAAANGVAQITALRDECDELRAEVERLREALLEAAETVQEWGEYAPAYAQKKWGLAKEVEHIRATAAKGETTND